MINIYVVMGMGQRMCMKGLARKERPKDEKERWWVDDGVDMMCYESRYVVDFVGNARISIAACYVSHRGIDATCMSCVRHIPSYLAKDAVANVVVIESLSTKPIRGGEGNRGCPTTKHVKNQVRRLYQCLKRAYLQG